MTKMCKLITLTILSFPVTAKAATNCTAPGGNTVFPDCIPKDDITVLIGNTINGFLILAGTVAVLFIIIGGFQYITSAGNPDGIYKAKQTLLYAIIGLIVVILSFAIVKFVINAF